MISHVKEKRLNIGLLLLRRRRWLLTSHNDQANAFNGDCSFILLHQNSLALPFFCHTIVGCFSHILPTYQISLTKTLSNIGRYHNGLPLKCTFWLKNAMPFTNNTPHYHMTHNTTANLERN